MPFYSNAANFALSYYDACCATHCSRFKISLRNFKISSHDASRFRRKSSGANAASGRNFKIPHRCFQNLRCLPLDTASLKFNQT
ncbi:hypothetical protein [uncultured Campylobacter sp.]|uniref:hypothetical protein n=1 Tax=uncultured Campylobacter sp. TaxID=218934 RepID=UPI0026081E83|nr:hypothetical protein [uncultured Campylobacter sp.]